MLLSDCIRLLSDCCYQIVISALLYFIWAVKILAQRGKGLLENQLNRKGAK